MAKKIIIILLILIIAGAGGYGTYHFYKENKANSEALAISQSSLSQAQAELNTIGQMTDVYVLSSDVLSGEEINENSFNTKSVPVSALNAKMYYTYSEDETHQNTESLIGKKFRSKYSAGTIFTDDMLMTEEEATSGIAAYPRVIGFNSLPVTLEVGDTVDLRLLLMNGDEYVVLDHKIVKSIVNNSVEFWISEEENAIINSMFQDLGVYNGACVAYLFKYLEPGNKQTLAFYPVSSEMESMLLFNPNIVDPTRCINQTLRAHLDQTLTILSDSINSGTSNTTMAYITTQIGFENEARSNYIQEKEQQKEAAESGEVTEGEEVVESASEADPEAID